MLTLGDSFSIIITTRRTGTGALFDPSAVVLRVKRPNGSISDQTNVIRDSLGTYHSDVVADDVGAWRCKAIATGDSAGSSVVAFNVASDGF